jgi:hypothetical protein
MIGVNPIAAKNNIIVTLHLDDKECSSERHAPFGKLHGDDTTGLHQVAPTPLSVRLIFMSSSSSLPSLLKMEYDIRLMAAPPLTGILVIGFPSM